MEQVPLIPELVGEDATERDSMGRPVQTPNGGQGRPRGAMNDKYKLLRHLAFSHAPEVWMKVISEAKNGNMLAARIFLDRIYPRPRTAPVTIDLPATETPADLRKAMHDLLGRVASGEITTDDGQAFISMLKDMLAAHSIETLLPSGGAPAAVDARDLLRERIVKVIEEKKRRELEAADAA